MTIIDGTEVGQLGFGMMGFTWTPTPTPVDEAVKVLRAAVEKGAILWNAGEFYGPAEYNSLHIIRKYFDTYPEDLNKIRFSVKGAVDFPSLEPNPTEAGIQKSIKFCQSILGPKIPLDLYEVARFRRDVPVQDTLNALKKAYDAGQIRGISLSEASANTVKLAHKTLGKALKTVEVEFSLFTLDPIENGVATACKESGIPMTAYSPLGRGFLAGKFKTPDDLGPFLKTIPRFQGDAFYQNLKLVDEIKQIADKKKATSAQVAIGWILAQSSRGSNPAILPIPGATRISRLDENLSPVKLTDSEIAQVDDLLKKMPVVGGRYDDAQSEFLTV